MSVITFPRRVDTGRPRRAPDPKRVRRLFRKSAAVRRTSRRPAPSRSHAHVRGASSLRKSCVIVIFALALSMAGSMVVANRQVELHALQSQLLQSQSTYAEQVGSNTNLAAPVSWRPRPCPALGLPRLGDASPVHVT